MTYPYIGANWNRQLTMARSQANNITICDVWEIKNLVFCLRNANEFKHIVDKR